MLKSPFEFDHLYPYSMGKLILFNYLHVIPSLTNKSKLNMRHTLMLSHVAFFNWFLFPVSCVFFYLFSFPTFFILLYTILENYSVIQLVSWRWLIQQLYFTIQVILVKMPSDLHLIIVTGLTMVSRRPVIQPILSSSSSRNNNNRVKRMVQHHQLSM